MKIGDSASVLSHGSSRSRSSRASSRLSHTELLRLKEEQKRAELTMRSAALNKEHELERSKQAIEMERQRLMQDVELSRLEVERQLNQLKLQTEIDVSSARLGVLDKYDGESFQLTKPESIDVNVLPPTIDGPFTEAIAQKTPDRPRHPTCQPVPENSTQDEISNDDVFPKTSSPISTSPTGMSVLYKPKSADKQMANCETR